MHSFKSKNHGLLGKTTNAFNVTTADSSAPIHIRSSDKTGRKPQIIGNDGYRFEVLHDWGELPGDIRYGNTHGIAEDAQGRIIVLHTVHETSPKGDAVVFFDQEGKFVKSWGEEFREGAHGLHYVKEGNVEFLYICDTSRRKLVKTTLDGEIVWERGCPEDSGFYQKYEDYVPTNVAVTLGGMVYVADGYGSNYIHIYNADGDYQSSFGGSGKGPGQLSCPHGLMIDNRGKGPSLVVADRENRRLQYFTLTGKHLKFVTDELRAPCHFHSRNGDLLIPDLESRITIFNSSNELITHLGDGTHFDGIRDKDRSAFTPGKFVAPHSAIFNHAGDIFVVEWVEIGRVTRLRRVS